MICPDCMAAVTAALPAIVGKAAGLIPTVGPIAGPLAEALTRLLIEALSGKPPEAVTRAEFPSEGEVVDRLNKAWGEPGA